MRTSITIALLLGAFAVGTAQYASQKSQRKLQPVTLAVYGMT